MTESLARARVLVADDQKDVAHTLCAPLRRAGVRLSLVTDGRAALDQIKTKPFDLVLVDMKMPPDEWGGLWLLEQLRNSDWKVPTLVLSGEGGKPQVIRALRMGASDWIDKEDAEQLAELCARVLDERLARSVEDASYALPTPVARRFADYARVTEPYLKVKAGLHALEATLRFAAMVGLSSTPPKPLPGITARRLGAPSMGIWLQLCGTLQELSAPGGAFGRLIGCLIADRGDRQVLQDLVTVRNADQHRETPPTSAQAEVLDNVLCRFAHRALASWRADLGITTSMIFDGTSYTVDFINIKGNGDPVPGRTLAAAPLVSHQLFLFSPDASPIALAPWLMVQPDGRTDTHRILRFDGTRPATSGTGRLLRYADAVGRDTGPFTQPEVPWQTVSAWTS